MAQRGDINSRIKWSHGTEQETNESIADSKTPEVQLSGGVYRTTLPTYADNDNAIMHFSGDGKLLVSTTNTPGVPATLEAGENTSVTTSAAILAADTEISNVIIQAHPDNSDYILVGNATGQYVIVYPAQSISIDIGNLNLIYLKANTGTQTVNYIAS